MHGRAARYALLAVGLLVLAYTIVMTRYTFGLQDTFRTNGEDLGIMDQVLWTTLHGHLLHQTICNPVTDVNCLGGAGGTDRFAIHFEPILLALSPLYLLIANVKILLFLQVAAVASAAFPAYLLASKRLNSHVWGVVFAGLLLVYPPLQNAVMDDFHPEVLGAAALLWGFYALSGRSYRTLIGLCVFVLLCKETLTLDVCMLGLYVAVVHRRWRLGVTLAAAGLATLALALLIMQVSSPVHVSPVAGRFGPLMHAPLATLAAMVRDHARASYLVKLLLPLGFLPLLSPWLAVIAVPSVLLNVLSGDPRMYSGLYQYNVDIAVVWLVAAIDALAWLLPALTAWIAQARAVLARHVSGRSVTPWLLRLCTLPVLASAVVVPAAAVAARQTVPLVYQDFAYRQTWPVQTAHDAIGQALAASIPRSASVSAQANLVPHVSQRLQVYQFPSHAYMAQYVFLDLAAGVYYPYADPQGFETTVHALLNSGQFSVVAARDGYVLLRHVSAKQLQDAGQPLALPPAFYTFALHAPPAGASLVSVRYADALDLIAYQVTPPSLAAQSRELVVTTYWRVHAATPVTPPLTVTVTLTQPNGKRLVYEDLLGQDWLPPSAWAPGQTIALSSWPIYLPASSRGALLLGVEVRAGAPEALPPVTDAVPATLNAPSAPAHSPHQASQASGLPLPRLTNRNTSALLAVVHVG
jgi:uncharacterized membrane protein